MIFDQNEKLIFKTNNREELYCYLSDIYSFDIYLKNSGTKEYRKSQPFAFYCFSFIDQLHFAGCSFESFKNMGQFSDIYLDIIYSHLGINNKEINNLTDLINASDKRISQLNDSLKTIKSMILRIDNEKDFTNYADSIKVVISNLEMHKRDYEIALNKINTSKRNLYQMYNLRSKLLLQINDINDTIKSNNNRILKTHSCPLCNSQLDNYTTVYFKKVRSDSELQYQLVDFEEELQAIERKINLEKNKYETEFKRLEELEKVIVGENVDVTKTITSMGVKKYKESLTSDYQKLFDSIEKEEEILKENKAKRKQADLILKQINDLFSNVLEEIILKYNLNIIQLPDNYSVKTKFTCSDNRILSTLWLTALNRVKQSLKDAPIMFPLVFDNPTDRDFDTTNECAILNMIFDCKKDNNQIIVTKVDFDDKQYEDREIDNIILLNNERYNLLGEQDYAEANENLKKLVSTIVSL